MTAPDTRERVAKGIARPAALRFIQQYQQSPVDAASVAVEGEK